jgi:hypothetical protein
MNGTWTAPTHVNGSGAPGSTDLRFGALFKLNTRLFFDLGQQKRLVRDYPSSRTRVSASAPRTSLTSASV